MVNIDLRIACVLNFGKVGHRTKLFNYMQPSLKHTGILFRRITMPNVVQVTNIITKFVHQVYIK